MRLWDPGQGALCGITAGVTGAGKSVLQNLILAAEKHSGVLSWVDDVQGGMSLPEAEGRVDWFAKGPVETFLILTAAHAVTKYRERVSNEMGRVDFALGRPWPLINITLDEINRLLSHPDEAMRKATAYMIADIQKTGRKVGIGIRFAVQSLHLKDLGDDDAICQQGKVGALFLMRTASSSTKEMGLDGIAPAGFQMENIPPGSTRTAGSMRTAGSKRCSPARTTRTASPPRAWPTCSSTGAPSSCARSSPRRSTASTPT
jgi:hypothetical protein